MYELVNAEKRDSKQVIRAHQLRKKGIIPAVVYGKGIESISVKIDKKVLFPVLSKNPRFIEIQVAGNKHLVNVEKIQKHAHSNAVLHVYFHKVKQGEATTITIPIIITGNAPGVKDGGVIHQNLKELDVTGLPENMPESINIDISTLALDGHIAVKDLKLGDKLELPENMMDEYIVACVAPHADTSTETPTAEAAATPAQVERVGEKEKEAEKAAAPDKDKK